MTAAVLIPSAFPDITHLSLLKHADFNCYFTGESFSRKSLFHRGCIRTREGLGWLTLPVHPSDKKKLYHETRLDASVDWISKSMLSLKHSYQHSTYFDFYADEIEADFQQAASFELLFDAVQHLRTRLFRYLEWHIHPQIIYTEAELHQFLEETSQKIVFTEPGSRYYRKRIPNQTEPQLHLPEYAQSHAPFLPGCCVLDLLFHYGPESFKVLDRLNPPVESCS